MALTPIQMFANPASQGLLGILSGSQNALTQGLQSAIQIGRDLSNNAVAGERDFLRERKNAEDLAQRRGENLQKQFNFDRSFERGAMESDRTFGRMTANDLFSKEMQRDEFGRRVENDQFTRESQGARIELDKAQEERMGDEFDMRKDEIRKTEEFNRGLLTPKDIFGPQLPPERQDPFTMSAEADLKITAATRAKNAPALQEATRQKAMADRMIAERRSTGDGTGLTPSEQNSKERLDMAKEDRAAKLAAAEKNKVMEKALAVPGAFPLQGQILRDPKEPAKLREGADPAQDAEYQRWDANQAVSEVAAAENSESFDEYLMKVVRTHDDAGKPLSDAERRAVAKALPAAVKKARRTVYDLAKGGTLTAPAPAPAARPTGSSYVRDNIKALE